MLQAAFRERARVSLGHLRAADRDVSRDLDPRALRIARLGVILTLVAVAGQTLIHLVNVVAFHLRYALLNVDYDFSVFSWASTSVTFSAAVLLVLLAAVRSEDVRLTVALAVATAYLSLDDAVQIHERISELSKGVPVEHFARTFWPLVYMPLLALVFLGMALLAAALPRPPARLLLLGLALLAVAIVLEMGSPLLFAIGLDHGDLGYEAEAAVEEGLELAGWMLVATATATALAETLGVHARPSD